MKTEKQISRLLTWPILLLFLSLIGARQIGAARALSPSFDPGTCDVVVNPGESIQSAINANFLFICVRGGVYQEAIVIPGSKPGRTLVAYGDGTPVIDGNKHLPGGLPAHQSLALVELQATGTVFDGFEVRHSSSRGLDVSAGNVTVRNSSVHDNWSTGILLRGSTQISNVLVENNAVYNNLLKVKHNPAIYRGERTGSGATDWVFDPEVNWDTPFWSGKGVDLPESSLNGMSLTFNDDGNTTRVYAGSVRSDKPGNISAEYSATGQAFTYSGNDILFHDPTVNKWTLFFKGSDFGLATGAVIDAFQIESPPPETLPCPSCRPILMSFSAPVTIQIAGESTTIGHGDLVRFSPSAVGQWDQITAGEFTLYMSATDLGLGPTINIDALDRAPDGRLLISVTADAMVGNQLVDKEDLAAYDETLPGWSLYFDGDQIPYNPFADDLTAAWLDSNGHIYISGDPIGGSALAFVEAVDSVARGNQVYNNYGEGLVSGRFSERITLEDNVVFDNYHANLYLNSTIAPLVQRNLVYCTDDPAFRRKGSSVSYITAPGIQIRDESFVGLDPKPPLSSGQVIVNNIVVGCSVNFGVSTQRTGGGMTDALVSNNVFANARGQSAISVNNVQLDDAAAYVNSRFVNNLIIQNTPGAILRVQGAYSDFSTFTVANNLYGIAPPASWFPGEAGRVVGNPNLANPTPPLPAMGGTVDPDDYRLTYASPALDAGQSLTEVTGDFAAYARGNDGPVDIGAFELPHNGRIIVVQRSFPAGSPQAFQFTANFLPDPFDLTDGQEQPSAILQAGTYSVTSAPVDNWTTTAICDDGSPPAAISLGPNETVICTFTSVEKARLIVTNLIEPAGDPQTFAFALTPGESFTLGAEERTFVVEPGTYSLQLSPLAGWVQEATCDNGDNPNGISLDPGEWVNCTFTQRKMGRIVVTKQTTPPDTPSTFSFTATYGDFTLHHGQSHDSGLLVPGVTYSVTEAPSPGWDTSVAACTGDDDGSDPSSITLDPGETVFCSFVNVRTTPGPLAKFYITAPVKGSVRGIAYFPGDILLYDNAIDAWTLYFDASNVGITKAINDFALLDDGSILVVFAARTKLPDQNGTLQTFEPQDIARFVPSQPGNLSAGWFEWYIDGSDVDLTTSAERIDALAVRPDGKLLISTVGAATVKKNGVNLKAADEDLLAFTPQTTGQTTTGTWELLPNGFDGSTLPGMAAENVTATWFDAETATHYLTVTNNFKVNGLSGTNRSILAVTSAGSATIYWDATAAGFAGAITGLHIEITR